MATRGDSSSSRDDLDSFIKLKPRDVEYLEGEMKQFYEGQLARLRSTHTELQQELSTISSDTRKHELEKKLAETEREITNTVAEIQHCEKQIQRLRGDSDREQSHKRKMKRIHSNE